LQKTPEIGHFCATGKKDRWPLRKKFRHFLPPAADGTLILFRRWGA
jgi:hypothetical protein